MLIVHGFYIIVSIYVYTFGYLNVSIVVLVFLLAKFLAGSHTAT